MPRLFQLSHETTRNVVKIDGKGNEKAQLDCNYPSLDRIGTTYMRTMLISSGLMCEADDMLNTNFDFIPFSYLKVNQLLALSFVDL